MIDSLQSLRGFFALMVFLSHFAINGEGDRAFYDGGTMAVEYFMVLSGFVLCAAYETRAMADRFSYRRFELKRLIRIYPLHIACLVGWVILNAGFEEFDAPTFIANLLLLQAWSTDVNVFYSYNIPSWYLSALLFFYLLFPLIIYFAVRSAKRFYIVFTAAVVAYLAFLIFCADGLDYDMQLWASRIFPLTRLLDFTLGIVLWQAFGTLKSYGVCARLLSSGIVAKTAVEMCVVALYVAAVLVIGRLDLVWQTQVVWWLPTAICILVFGSLDRDGGFLTKLLDCRWLVVFGNASFAFYLLHCGVARALGRFLHHFDITPDVWQRLVLELFVAVVVSLIVTRYFDKPVTGRLKRMLAK